jgi:hypothetical protein
MFLFQVAEMGVEAGGTGVDAGEAAAEIAELFLQLGPPAAITGFFTVRRVPWIMLWTVFSVFIN